MVVLKLVEQLDVSMAQELAQLKVLELDCTMARLSEEESVQLTVCRSVQRLERLEFSLVHKLVQIQDFQ